MASFRSNLYKPRAQANEAEWKDKLFTYFRFTTSFSRQRFEDLNVANRGKIDIEAIQQMDCVSEIGALEEIGKAVAKEQVFLEHFNGFLED